MNEEGTSVLEQIKKHREEEVVILVDYPNKIYQNQMILFNHQ